MHSFRRATLSLLRSLENANLLCFMSVIFPCCWHAKVQYSTIFYYQRVKHRPTFKFHPISSPLLSPQHPAAMAKQKFEDVFPRIRSELIDHIAAQGMPKEAIQWYTDVRATATLHRPECANPEQNLNYNVPGGKLNRGISVVDSLQVLKGAALTEDEYQRAAILGWCVELVSLVLSSPR